MYDITTYTKDRAKKVGLEVRPSKRKGKKIDVFKDGQYVASVGAIGYKDFPTFEATEGREVAEEHRRRYHLRHTKETLGELLALYLLW
jgi:hypothetical protein